jgi:hypothetical protein
VVALEVAGFLLAESVHRSSSILLDGVADAELALTAGSAVVVDDEPLVESQDGAVDGESMRRRIVGTGRDRWIAQGWSQSAVTPTVSQRFATIVSPGGLVVDRAIDLDIVIGNQAEGIVGWATLGIDVLEDALGWGIRRRPACV